MDELIIEEVWMGFMQRLLSEWTDFVLYVGLFSNLQNVCLFDAQNLTVNCDACYKCRFPCHPGCHVTDRMDQTLSRSDCEFHIVNI